MGILGLLSLAVMTMTENQNKQIQYFQNKISINETKQFLNEVISKQQVCDWQLQTATTGQFLNLNSKKSDGQTLNSEINLNKIYTGINSLSSVVVEKNKELPGSKTVVSKITVANIKSISSDIYEGEIVISFNSIPNQIKYADIKLRKTFKVNPINPSYAPIISCYYGSNLRIIGANQIQSLSSDRGNVVCKPITFAPGCPINKIITSGSVLYPNGGGTWGHYTYLFRFMNTINGTGQFCWDTGGDFNGHYGTEQFSYVIYCAD